MKFCLKFDHHLGQWELDTSRQLTDSCEMITEVGDVLLSGLKMQVIFDKGHPSHSATAAVLQDVNNWWQHEVHIKKHTPTHLQNVAKNIYSNHLDFTHLCPVYTALYSQHTVLEANFPFFTS